MPTRNGAAAVLPIGTIVPTVRNPQSLPSGWLACDGKPLPAWAQELTTLLGGPNTPNLIGRSLIGAGATADAQSQQTDGLTPNIVSLGAQLEINATGGECLHTLVGAEMPKHSHTINGGNFYTRNNGFQGLANSDSPYETSGDNLITGTDIAGGDGGHYNVQPFYVVTYMIYAGDPSAPA